MLFLGLTRPYIHQIVKNFPHFQRRTTSNIVAASQTLKFLKQSVHQFKLTGVHLQAEVSFKDTMMKEKLLTVLKDSDVKALHNLVNDGLSVNTALFYAVRANSSKEIISYLFSQGANANTIIEKGNGDSEPIFHQVCQLKNLSLVEQFIEEGKADVNGLNSNEQTALDEACDKTDTFDLVKFLLKNQSELRNEKTKSAIQSNDLESLNFLIAEGMSVNTALLYAIQQSNPSKEIISYLFLQGANANKIIHTGKIKEPIFHLVCRLNNLPLIEQFIVEGKAEINAFNSEEQTALDQACEKKESSELIKLLLKYKANPDLLIRNDNGGKEPIFNKVCRLNNEYVELLLVEGKANVNGMDSNGNGALDQACEKKDNSELIKLLLKYKANPNLLINNGYGGKEPIFHKVCRLNHLPYVKQLIEDGEVDVNGIDHEGRTVLDHACAKNDTLGLIKLLLENKANPNILNKKGHPAIAQIFSSTSRNNRCDVLAELVKHKADLTLYRPLLTKAIDSNDLNLVTELLILKVDKELNNNSYRDDELSWTAFAFKRFMLGHISRKMIKLLEKGNLFLLNQREMDILSTLNQDKFEELMEFPQIKIFFENSKNYQTYTSLAK